MSFEILPDNKGMVYVPVCKPGKNKYPCRDCFSCQWCGNERCCVCWGKNVKKNDPRRTRSNSHCRSF